MRRAVICVRVSPRPQDRVRWSPEIQEAACRRWCETQEVAIVGTIQDLLISGGDPKRFASIFQALDELRPEVFVVQDLSRWTREDPAFFWTIYYQLRERNIQLVSADETYLDPEMPFFYTLTTARVEANFQERLILRRKTSAGVRRAWANGKRWGKPWGWVWSGQSYEQDVARIRALYEDWIAGLETRELSRRYGILPVNIARTISRPSQREVVPDLWDRAQERVRAHIRSPRRDTRTANIYRGLLRCPFCGRTLKHWSSQWGTYRCPAYPLTPHGFTSLSSMRYVTPAVEQVLDRLVIPDDEDLVPPPPPEPARRPREEIEAALDDASEAFIKRRISRARYEKVVAELQAELEAPPPPPAAPRQEVVRDLRLMIPDLRSHDPVLGTAVNRLLQELFVEIKIDENRRCTPIVRPEYLPWLKEAAA